MIKVYNNRIVSPTNVKISNKFENDTRTIQFDLSDITIKGNVYLICKYEKDNEYKTPLLLDEKNSIPVKTFLSAKAGAYKTLLVISNIVIDNDYNFSDDNITFISNEFVMTVEDNFLNGTAVDWELSPEMQIKFDELLSLIKKVQSDLDGGAFNGVGIKSIKKVGTQGLVDIYRITFTNDTTFDYQVTNGAMPSITVIDGNWHVNGVDTGQKAQGDNGLSAYEVAVKNGFQGTEQEWLESLKYQSSPEFNQLAEQVRSDAQKTSQNKKDVESLVASFNTNYDTKLKEFNDNAKSKNEEFNTNAQQANTIIDNKVTEATKQAQKAKDEADRAEQATDGKLDKNLGADNANKLLGTDNEGNIVVKDEIKQTAANVSYGDNSNVEVALDDINKKLGDLMYTPISITSFTNNKNTQEMGSTITDVTLNWNYNKTPKTLMLDSEPLNVSLKTKTLTGQSIKANKTFILKATDERDAVATKTTAITFLNGVYYGIGDDLQIGGITNQFILGLTKTLQSSKAKTFTVNAGAGKHIYYIIPTRYGTPIFKVGGFEGGFEKLGTVNFTNSSSYAENYDVYKSSNAGLGNTTVVVS